MKSIVVYYFSGTGNTEIVASMLRDGFSGLECAVTLIRIEDILNGDRKVDPGEYDLVGIGCPVIGYGVPKIVRDFVRLLPKANHKKTFIFRTAGGVAPVNYNASKSMIRKLAGKGYDVFHERVFSISSNWIVKFDDAVIRQLHEATGRKAAIMCREVVQGENRILRTGIGLRVRMELMMHAFSGFFRLIGKDMVVDKACSDCGLCIKECPSRNIVRKNGKIRFNLSCNSCMRCVYSCPRSAIHFRFLSFFPVPGGYDIKKVLNPPHNADETASGRIPPFFGEYIRNDSL